MIQTPATRAVRFLAAALFIPFLTSVLLGGCALFSGDTREYRQDMRDFVIDISAYGKAASPGFIVIPQNGQEILTTDGEPDGPLASNYAAAIDGSGREDLFYGYNNDDEATPPVERDWMLAFCDRMESEGVEVLAIDYCSTASKVTDSYTSNQAKGYISLAAPDRELRVIPASGSYYPYHADGTSDINSLSDAKNLLYLLNSENYTTKAAYLSALQATDYDILIIDAFYNDVLLTPADVASLQTKYNNGQPGGGRRPVIAYMSIGEAEDYRWYWDSSWNSNPPSWIEAENPDWPGNYLVRYWDPGWQAIIYGSSDSYLDKILSAGFDGVYLDIIDAYERFE